MSSNVSNNITLAAPPSENSLADQVVTNTNSEISPSISHTHSIAANSVNDVVEPISPTAHPSSPLPSTLLYSPQLVVIPSVDLLPVQPIINDHTGKDRYFQA